MLGSGKISSLTEFDNELFNAAKTTFKDQDINFKVNGHSYASILKNDREITLDTNFPSEELEKFSNINKIDFKVEKTLIGMYKLKAPEGFNLYKLEDESYIRDRNGYIEHASKEDAIAAVNYYFKEDEKQNTFNVQQKDLTKVFIDNQFIDSYRGRKSTINLENNDKNNQIRKLKLK